MHCTIPLVNHVKSLVAEHASNRALFDLLEPASIIFIKSIFIKVLFVSNNMPNNLDSYCHVLVNECLNKRLKFVLKVLTVKMNGLAQWFYLQILLVFLED